MNVLRFRFLDLPVQILPGFWLLVLLIAVLIGGASPAHVAVAFVVAAVSLAAHEFGHAFAARRVGFKPVVTLHMTGGLTHYPTVRKVGRLGEAMIALSGPLSGLLLAGLCYAALRILDGDVHHIALAGEPAQESAGLMSAGLLWAVELNFFWSSLNLLPLLPFDGGRVLLAIFGKRRNVAAHVSLAAGLGLAGLFLVAQQVLPAIVFVTAGIVSYMRIRRVELLAQGFDTTAASDALTAAESALERRGFKEARVISERVFQASDDLALRRRAIQCLLWSLLGDGESHAARALLDALSEDDVDPYVAGAVLHASGSFDRASALLTRARIHGDARLEVRALLVRVLFDAGQYRDAANAVLELTREVPVGDVREIADQAQRSGAHLEAARVSLKLAEEEASFADARTAVLGFQQAGSLEDTKSAYRLAAKLDRAGARSLLDDERLAPWCAELAALS